MTARITLVSVLACSLTLGPSGCDRDDREGASRPDTPEADETDVLEVVTRFGERLKSVSIAGPAPLAASAIREQYADLIAPDLLEEWMRDPRKAAGRLVSSPWPDRIEVGSVSRIDEERFLVTGSVIEVTSADRGEPVRAIPVRMTVQRLDGNWRITEYDESGAGEAPPGTAALGADGAMAVIEAFYEATIGRSLTTLASLR